jgi:hypothetical protein
VCVCVFQLETGLVPTGRSVTAVEAGNEVDLGRVLDVVFVADTSLDLPRCLTIHECC